MSNIHFIILALGIWHSQVAFVRSQDAVAIQYNRDGSPDDPGLTHFQSRPDLMSPKWAFTMHDEALNSPGYWFVAPYRGINGEQSKESWVGPCIYDGSNGELVWSGGLSFHSNVEDFRISNVNGEAHMTLFASNQVVVLNDDYRIHSAKTLETQGALNTHELNFVEDGTRAILLRNGVRRVSKEDAKTFIGTAGDKECNAKYDEFSVLDVTKDDWPEVFRWQSFGNIGLDESTYIVGNPDSLCRGWDYIHANSVDKTPKGDYLFSARHTNTIYKISGTDGSILWRLGGKNSSFARSDDLVFSRQHDVRYRGQNDTHLFISILDNAKGQDDQPNTHDSSRGLLIAIEEETMRASVQAQIDHPYRRSGALAIRRGNYQSLPNGNIFMGWSERAMQSEHTPDGKLVWEAILQVDWMGSYRNYKFDGFVGKPKEPPTAVCRAHSDERGTSTVVYVSWNGATEVSKWNMYKTSPDGETTRILVATAQKVGFETTLRFSGYAKYLVVDAIDAHGHRIGNVSIDAVADSAISAEAVAEEEQWLQDLEMDTLEVAKRSGKAVAAFGAGMICGVMVLLAFRYTRQHGAGMRFSLPGVQRYTPVPQ